MSCASCLGPKATFECGICHAALCKSCVQAVDTHSFSYMSKIPPVLKLGNVCPTCFDSKILPHKIKNDEIMEKAQDVYFLTKAYPGYVRVLRKHSKRVSIEECRDRRETILRMAYVAAELGFNAIIDAEVESSKIRMGKYQSSTWKGSSLPALVDGAQLERASLRRI